MNYKNVASLKSVARGKLLGKYSVATGALVFIQLILFLINSVVSGVADTNSPLGILIYSLITLIVELIATAFIVGELTIYLNFACGNNAKATDVFSGFNKHPDKAILVRIIVFFRTIVWLIPCGIFSVIYFFDRSDILLAVLIITAVAGIVGFVYTAVNLSQCFYLLLDFPQYSAVELVRYSGIIMKGHRGRYLRLAVSFIPLCVLGLLSAGIGFLFIHPYVRMTYTEFYLEIIREPDRKPSFEAIVDENMELQIMKEEDSDL